MPAWEEPLAFEEEAEALWPDSPAFSFGAIVSMCSVEWDLGGSEVEAELVTGSRFGESCVIERRGMWVDNVC